MNKKQGIQFMENVAKKLNESIEKQIAKMRTEEAIERIGNMNICELKTLFESVSDKQPKTTLAKYLKTVKGNKAAKDFYGLYESIAGSKIAVNNTGEAMKLFLSLMEGLDRKQLEQGRKNIAKIVKEAIINAGVNEEYINKAVENKKQLNENMTYLLENKLTPNNINEVSNRLNALGSMLDRTEAEEDVPSDRSNKDLLLDLEKSIAKCKEGWEREAVERIFLNNVAGKSDSELFEAVKFECVSILDKQIEECDDVENKAILNSMKEGLEKKCFNEETYMDDVLKMSDLKNTLENETDNP